MGFLPTAMSILIGHMKLWAISPATLIASEAIAPIASRMNEGSKLIINFSYVPGCNYSKLYSRVIRPHKTINALLRNILIIV